MPERMSQLRVAEGMRFVKKVNQLNGSTVSYFFSLPWIARQRLSQSSQFSSQASPVKASRALGSNTSYSLAAFCSALVSFHSR